MVLNQHVKRQRQAFKLRCANSNPPHVKESVIHPSAPHIGQSAAMWDEFVSTLSQAGIRITKLQKDKPDFGTTQS